MPCEYPGMELVVIESSYVVIIEGDFIVWWWLTSYTWKRVSNCTINMNLLHFLEYLCSLTKWINTFVKTQTEPHGPCINWIMVSVVIIKVMSRVEWWKPRWINQDGLLYTLCSHNCAQAWPRLHYENCVLVFAHLCLLFLNKHHSWLLASSLNEACNSWRSLQLIIILMCIKTNACMNQRCHSAIPALFH